MAVALPRLLSRRTVISCRWDTGADGHRQIMAKHGVGVEPLFCLDFWDCGRARARGAGTPIVNLFPGSARSLSPFAGNLSAPLPRFPILCATAHERCGQLLPFPWPFPRDRGRWLPVSRPDAVTGQADCRHTGPGQRSPRKSWRGLLSTGSGVTLWRGGGGCGWWIQVPPPLPCTSTALSKHQDPV